MYSIATTTAAILRGTALNAYGDEVDTDTPIATGVPVALAVTQTTPYDPTTQQIRIIRNISGQIQSDTDIRESDRLRDETTGVVYIVESVTDTLGPGFLGDLELVLKQVT